MLYIEGQVASVASMSSNQSPISATYLHHQLEPLQTTLAVQALLTQVSPLPTRRSRPIPKAKTKPIKPGASTTPPSHLCYWANNPCSLNNDKRQELFARLSTLHKSSWPHVIFFAKTWFTELSDVSIPGYQPHRKDRNNRGGGVAIYTRDDIIVSEVSATQLNSTSIEQIWRKIKLGQESFLLGCLYRPHDLDDQVLTQCITSITTARQILPNINCSAMLLYGDFNFSHTLYESIEVNGGITTVAHMRGKWQGNIRS